MIIMYDKRYINTSQGSVNKSNCDILPTHCVLCFLLTGFTYSGRTKN